MKTLQNGELRFTISDIKYFTENKAPLFFSRKALRFFGQKMSDFKIEYWEDGRVLIKAPIIIDGRRSGGYTRRFFIYNHDDPMNSTLESYTEDATPVQKEELQKEYPLGTEQPLWEHQFNEKKSNY